MVTKNKILAEIERVKELNEDLSKQVISLKGQHTRLNNK